MPIDYTKRRSSPPPPEEPEKPKISYSKPSTTPAGGKVVLTKSAPTVSLTKGGSATGTMRVNLRWTARPEGGSGFFKRQSSIDLDLGCLYEFTDGSKGVVQALGDTFVATTAQGKPLVVLDGDDRSGTNSAGENLRVDLSRPEDIRRILFFAFIYDGVPNWAAADGVVTAFPQSGPHIETRLDASSTSARMCAIAILERTGNELVLRRENRYIEGGHRQLDAAYGWGLRWTAGSK